MSRLSTGGRIDRGRPLGFTIDGRSYQGFAGDTLASICSAAASSTTARAGS
jgi:2Fe-2S iron-sulfur cluster binding domain